jgi:hypothetical protein
VGGAGGREDDVVDAGAPRRFADGLALPQALGGAGASVVEEHEQCLGVAEQA